jgi:hypothetical protein
LHSQHHTHIKPYALAKLKYRIAIAKRVFVSTKVAGKASSYSLERGYSIEVNVSMFKYFIFNFRGLKQAA